MCCVDLPQDVVEHLAHAATLERLEHGVDAACTHLGLGEPANKVIENGNTVRVVLKQPSVCLCVNHLVYPPSLHLQPRLTRHPQRSF